MRATIGLLVLGPALVGCSAITGNVTFEGALDAGGGGTDGGMDAGRVDAGDVDAGDVDAGAGVDGGGMDAGGMDAGGMDAGGRDAGVDASLPDAGPPCNPAVELCGVDALCAGSNFTCALLSDRGRVACWGAGPIGELGGPASSRAPVLVTSGSGGPIQNLRQIACGRNHVCARDNVGQFRCWGAGEQGQVGDGTSTRSNPDPVVAVTGSPRLAADVSAGGNLSIGRMDDGTVYGWGANGFSQLASGIAPGSLASPRRASALDGYRAAVTGFGHLCATTASPGTVRCQGNNFNGQIGDGTNTNRDTPTLVMSLSDATGLAAGDTHMCALRASGDVACWGRGLDGQLGDGAGASSNVPVRAALPAAASGVWAGTQHACARTDAGVYCWGANGSGQLGDGTRDATLVPVLASLPDAVSMALGNSHSCALAGNGSVRCWGANADGQLGDGTVTDRLGPAVVVPITP